MCSAGADGRVAPRGAQQTDQMRPIGEEAMSDITDLNFDKDGELVGRPPVVAPEITDVVLIAHGWNEGAEGALGHYRDLVGPLELILSQYRTHWQGHTAAYFGVIWPSAKYADDLTVINMRADVVGPPPLGVRADLSVERRGSRSASSGRGAVSRD